MNKKPPKRPISKAKKNKIKEQIAKAQPVEMGFSAPGPGEKPQYNSNKMPSDFDNDNEPLKGFTPKELELAKECALLDQNDRDNARRLVIWFGKDLIFVVGMGWITWRGTHWQRDDGELQTRLKAQNLVDKIKPEVCFIEASSAQHRLFNMAEIATKKPVKEQTPEDVSLISKAMKARDLLLKKKTARRTFAISSGNAPKTNAMLAQAASLLAKDQDALDSDRMSLNVKNGTLKIDKATAEIKFYKHQRSDLITKMAEVSYDPEATCPEWEKFLARVQPNDDLQLFLQVFHGYTMLAGNDEQKIIFHYGSGANGKSVFIETLGRLSGEYRAVVSPDTFTGDGARGGQQASPDLARLFNARIATIEELPRGAPLKESLIKSVSGGTRILARFLLKENFEFEPLFTAVMSGNDMPEVSGTDFGIWRRLLLVQWPITIPIDEQIAFGAMLEKFDNERAGILNWLLDGIRLYLEKGLNKYIPNSVTKFADEYREDKDPVGEFVKACIKERPGEKVQAKDMFEAYQKWCEANGLKAWQQTAFGRRLGALGFEKARGRLIFYLNCELVAGASKFDPPITDDEAMKL